MAEYSKPGFVLRNGIAMLQSHKIGCRAVSNDKEVETLLLGLAGFSDGAQMVEYSVSGAIPLAGFEYDATAICLAHTTQDLAFKIAGVVTTARGRVTDTNVETSVNTPNGLDFTFKGFVLSRAAG